MSRRTVLALAIAAAALGAVSVERFASAEGAPAPGAAGPGRGEADDASAPLPVRVLRVALRDHYRVADRVAGRVRSRRASALGFERSGRIARVEVDEGERVAQGALLAEFDVRALRAQAHETAARSEAIRARLRLARATRERQQKLFESDHTPAQRLDEAVANEAAVAAELAANEAALARVRVHLSLSQLRAPFDAIVTVRHLDEGAAAAPAQPVLEVVEDGLQELRAGVPPELVGALREAAASARLRVEIAGTSRSARLVALVPSVDPATRTQLAVLAIDPPARPDAETDAAVAAGAAPARFADGRLGHVLLEREIAARGAWIPLDALAEGRRGTWTAFVVVRADDGTERLERRQLEVLHSEARRAFVRGTLRDGERIVSTGVRRLVPGLAVRVVGERGAAADAAAAGG